MIIWLASYPKSGNTWVRAFITNYLIENSKNVFGKMNKIKRFPAKKNFIGIVNEDEIKKKPTELYKYFLHVQEKINENKKINILKTHNIGGSIKGHPFTNSNNTCGLIYLVRDPRSVALSYAYHANISFEKSVEHLLNDHRISVNEKIYAEIRSSWKIHILSWLYNGSWPKILIKYEDLHANEFKYFKTILQFINKFTKIEINDEKIKKTINVCNFKNLSELEKKEGFEEKVGNVNFFRKGETEEWKNKLPKNLIKKIEETFKKEMKDLNYL